jgi:hypothetical protein
MKSPLHQLMQLGRLRLRDEAEMSGVDDLPADIRDRYEPLLSVRAACMRGQLYHRQECIQLIRLLCVVKPCMRLTQPQKIPRDRGRVGCGQSPLCCYS